MVAPVLTFSSNKLTKSCLRSSCERFSTSFFTSSGSASTVSPAPVFLAILVQVCGLRRVRFDRDFDLDILPLILPLPILRELMVMFTLASFQSRILCEARYRPFSVAVFAADQGAKPVRVDFGIFKILLHQYRIPRIQWRVHGLKSVAYIWRSSREPRQAFWSERSSYGQADGCNAEITVGRAVHGT